MTRWHATWRPPIRPVPARTRSGEGVADEPGGAARCRESVRPRSGRARCVVRDPPWDVRHAPRPLGLRQDDDPQSDRRAGDAHPRLGAPSIFVTHDQEEAMMLSDAIAVMRDGEVVQYGPADEIYRSPQDLYVATFIGKPQMSTVSGRVRASRDGITFDAPDFRLAWPVSPDGSDQPALDTQAILGIRAEDVRITPADGETSGPDRIIVAASLLEPLGSYTFVEVNCGAETLTGRGYTDR